VAANFVAYVAWRDGRKKDDGTALKEQVQGQIATALEPAALLISGLSQKFEAHLGHEPVILDAALARSLQPVREDIAVLKSQVEVFWKQVGFNMATTLHQPDPARKHVDTLLEAFMAMLDDGPPMGPGEVEELRRLLVVIRDWEPGQRIDFPVRQGEQAAAGLLLSVMSHVIPPRELVNGGKQHA
jgi:hypothetical protein